MHIGYCGIQCHGCQVYKAAFETDPVIKLQIQKKIAQEWTTQFHHDFQPEHMVCEGCQSEKLCGYCSQCQLRVCAKVKQVGSCQDCAEYPCEKLLAFKKQAVNLSPDMKFVF